jgi:Family of unknown function (DUF5670)
MPKGSSSSATEVPRDICSRGYEQTPFGLTFAARGHRRPSAAWGPDSIRVTGVDTDESIGGAPEVWRRAMNLLLLIVAILVVLWLLGILVPGFSFGGLIHLLLVIALIVLVIWLIQYIIGRRHV